MQNIERAFEALKAADAAGNVEDATKLANWIRELQAEQQAEPEGDPVYDNEYNPAEGEQPFNVGFGDYTMQVGSLPEAAANTLAGLGHGVNKIKEGVTDLAYRAGSVLGVDGADDALSRLSKKQEVDRASWDHLKDSSGHAEGASLAGEVITTGVGGYGIASKAMARGMSAWKAATLEGMVVEGATTSGDIGERAQKAVVGGLTGGVTQKALDGLGSVYDRGTRRADADGLTALADTTLDDASANVVAAREEGGFTLGMDDATGDSLAIREASDIRQLPEEGFNLRTALANQEIDITDRAQSFIDGTGGNRLELSEVGESMHTQLLSLRNNETEAYRSLYRELDDATGGRPLNTDDLEVELPDMLRQFDTSSAPVVKKITALLKKYGIVKTVDNSNLSSVDILGPDGLPVSSVNRGSSSVVPPEKPLTASNYESLIRELNDNFEPTGNRGINRAVQKTKAHLEEWIDGALENQGVDPSLVALGRAARAGRVKFRDLWEQGDVVDKMTSTKNGTDTLRMNPSQGITHLTAPKNVGQLTEVVRRLKLGNEADVKVLSNLQQVPLIKAFDKAMSNTASKAEGGIQKFDHKAFKREFDKVSESAKVALYGASKAKEINSAVRTWQLRGSRASVSSGDSEGGLMRAAAGIIARLFLPSGRASGAALAGLPALRKLTQSFDGANASRASDALTSGRMTEAHIASRAKRLQEEIMDHYRGTDMLNYDTVIATLSRAWAREETTDRLKD